MVQQISFLGRLALSFYNYSRCMGGGLIKGSEFYIIVIGGGSFQGKSLVATYIAYKFNISTIISTDLIRNVLKVQNPGAPYLSTSTYLMSPENLRRQMEAVSLIIEKVLKIYESRGESLVIEGMHLSKRFMKKLGGMKNVFGICLDNQLPFLDRIALKSLTRKRVEYRDPVTGKITYGSPLDEYVIEMRYMPHAKRIREIHENILRSCEESGFKVLKFLDISKCRLEIEDMVRSFIRSREPSVNYSDKGD